MSLAFIVGSGTSLKLECTFTSHNSPWGIKYACEVKNLITFLSDRTITEIEGTHLKGKSNDDVEAVLAEHQSCQYMPTNLGYHFKNLIILKIMKSKILHLTKDDLAGLTKLRQLDLSYNPITRLHNDFFKGHPTIERFSFYDCSLNFIEKGALDSLTSLKEAHFQHNECIDYRGDDESLLPEMMRVIKRQCEGSRLKDMAYDETTHKHHEFEYDDEYDALHNHGFTVRYESNTNETTKTSFVRRNVFVIIVLLLVIILAIVGFLYKIKAFNRQSLY